MSPPGLSLSARPATGANDEETRTLPPPGAEPKCGTPCGVFWGDVHNITFDRAVFDFQGATVSISAIDDAIANVSDARSSFGSVQNRLEHTLNNLASYEENLTASESRIKDVDMASEMVQFTKYQILQQAGTSMLAQANAAPQSVLSLLHG